ncbi:MAG TPA: hypothetical protein PKL31_16535, partial [Fulvivirga sp.]|nr:hypothetical protein [Fulvivirga sp.]
MKIFFTFLNRSALTLIFLIGSWAVIFAQTSINASVTQHVTCFDSGNGEITLNITAGTPPFVVEFFVWDGSSEAEVATITGTSDPTIVLNTSITLGTGSVSYGPGYPGFGIRANDNPTQELFFGVGNEYRVRVTGSQPPPANVKTVSGLTVSEPAEISQTEIISDNTNCITPDGSIDITVSGGVGPFGYSWTGDNGFGPDTNEDISNLVAGDYTVVVTDNSTVGCSKVFGPFTVGDPLPSDALAVSDATICNAAESDVIITITNAESGVDYELQTVGGASLVPAVTGTGTGADLNLTILQANAPTTNTTYKVHAVAGICTPIDLLDQPTITVNDQPDNSLTVSDPGVCNPVTSDVDIIVNSAESGVSYEVTIGGTPLTPPVIGLGTGANLTLTILQADAPTISTTYDIVASINGCSDVTLTDQAVATVTNTVTIALGTVTDPTTCAGTEGS